MERKETSAHWDLLLPNMEAYMQRTLSMLSPRDLDGRPAYGVTETGFKLAVLGFFALTPHKMEVYEVVSELEVEGGYVDLYVKHRPTGEVLLIELKYKRLPFLKELVEKYNPMQSSTTLSERNARNKLWNTKNEEIMKMGMTEIENLMFQTQTTGGFGYQSVNTALDEAMKQVQTYVKALRAGTKGPKRIEPNTPAYWVVLVGLGTRVIMLHNAYSTSEHKGL